MSLPALAFLVAAAIFYFLLPDRTIDPWDLFNPRKNVLLLLLIFTVEYASYFVSRSGRARRSNILLGMLAGFVSSTALVLTSSRLARAHPDGWRVLVVRAISGQIASLLEMLLIVVTAAPETAVPVLLLCTGPLLAGVLILYKLESGSTSASALPFAQKPPGLRHILSLTLVLLGILGFISLAQRVAGNSGQIASAALSGLFELHAFSLAAATFFAQGKVEGSLFLWMITIAACASFASKAALAAAVGGGTFARKLMALSALLAASILSARLLLP